MPADTEIPYFELNPAGFCRIHLVARECRKYVRQVDVLMGVLVDVQIVDSLKETSRNRFEPDSTVEIIQIEQIRDWTVTTLVMM